MTPTDQPTAISDTPAGTTAVIPGQTVRVRLPYSEVCCHMRVAGAVMLAELTDTPHPMVQLRKLDDSCPFSFPIGTGEAGIYGDRTSGFYTYPDES